MLDTVGDLREYISEIPDDAEFAIIDYLFPGKCNIDRVFASETELKIII